MSIEGILVLALPAIVSICCLYIGVKAVIEKKFHDKRRTVRGSRAVFGGIIGIIVGLGLLVYTILDVLKLLK